MTASRNDIAFAARTQGKRERQEDSFRLVELEGGDPRIPRLLLLVADGMGGQAAGDLASDSAAESFVRHAQATRLESVPQHLRQCLDEANKAIASRVQEDPARAGMGTTMLAVVIDDGVAHWISVGDSVLYLLRGKALVRLNEDHSLAGQYQEMVRRGELSQAEAERRGGHNQLRSALMGDAIPLVDQSDKHNAVTLLRGDALLLATDGVLTLNEAEIASLATAARRSAKDLVETLLSAVIERDALRQDNTTVAVYVHDGQPSRLSSLSNRPLTIALAILIAGLTVALIYGASLTDFDKLMRNDMSENVALQGNSTSPENATRQTEQKAKSKP